MSKYKVYLSDSRIYRPQEDELVDTVELNDDDMIEEQIEKELKETAMEPIDWWFEKVEVSE